MALSLALAPTLARMLDFLFKGLHQSFQTVSGFNILYNDIVDHLEKELA